MAQASDFPIDRRTLLLALSVLAAADPALAARPKPVVTMLGDSITAGLGLPAAETLPAQLALALRKIGAPAEVRGAGVSGDTTADGLARLDFSVRPDTRVCVVELGGNDLLQGVSPGVMRANLLAIVGRLKARGVAVVLAGIAAPPVAGAKYARAYDAAFASVASAERVLFYPNLLAGVGPSLRQPDGIHPSAGGVKIIAEGLAPLVARALKEGARRR